MSLNHKLRLFVRHLTGIDVSRYDISQSPAARVAALCRSNAIDTVLDVGANVGDYATELLQAGYKGRILSIEPLNSAHDTLKRRAASELRWDVASRMAVGDRDGEVEIHVAHNLVSSSLRQMLPQHLSAAPESRYVGTERVALRRLDGVSHPFITQAESIMLKIDTQGFEKQVLAGAQGLMPRVKGLQLEMSLCPLYEGQALFKELYEDLISVGFELFYTLPGFADPGTGRMLQMDCWFFRVDTPAVGS